MTPNQKKAAEAGEPPVWHELSAAVTAQRLGSYLGSGLSLDEAARRLARNGRNEIREQGRRGLFTMVVSQFKDFMIFVLIAAALVSGIVGDAEDTIVILAIVLLNAAIGISQDFRAERAMAALKRLAAVKAEVVRAGHRQTIAAAEIVDGDIVLLEAGGAVPADLRLIEAPRLKITEAALTGEPVPVEKRATPWRGAWLTELSDRRSRWAAVPSLCQPRGARSTPGNLVEARPDVIRRGSRHSPNADGRPLRN
jgi:P-type Ca2+ transporter type 2C